jgi:HK97 family phage major capsid protein
VSSFLPSEISNQVIQGENYQIISCDGTAPDQTGLLNQSDTAIDDILNAANDIRVGSSYANADLAILNPSDWLSIRRIKSTQGLYVLDQNDPGQLGGIDHLFQLRVAATTSIPQGTALVLDSTRAVNIFRRWGLEVQVNPYSGDEFKANQLVVRAETRFGVACVYPHMVCKVTGLFPPA